jgi:hypothetical protein
MNGIEQEFIDIIQGRKAKTVFAMHYFRPDFDTIATKVRELTKNLFLEIIGENRILPLKSPQGPKDSKALNPSEDVDQRVNQKLKRIVPMIQLNPDLAFVKPDRLAKKSIMPEE